MKKSAIVLFCSAALCLVWTRAHAVCDQTSASTADVDLWNTHGCWGDFFRWSYKEAFA